MDQKEQEMHFSAFFHTPLNNIGNCCTICTYNIFVRLTASRV